MKILFSLLAGLLLCGTAVADHHMPAQPVIYGQYYGIVASDPGTVVAAMKKYRASATGQKMPSAVTLSQTIANGDQETTHSINVFYPMPAAMDTAAQLTANSPDTAEFRKTMSGVATIETENLFSMLISKTNQADMENPATMLFGLKVTDKAAFMKALNTLLDSPATADFPGNLFFGEVIAMGDWPGTHWVSFQAQDVATLLTGVDTYMKSADFAAYAKNASDFREVVNRSVSRQVLSLDPPAPAN